MCGRYLLKASKRELSLAFELPEENLPVIQYGRYNIAPTQDVVALTTSNDGARTISAFRWGLIPSWAKDASIGNKLINARAETITEKPSFRDAFKKRRCLVLAEGFYEWKKIGTKKQPYFIFLKNQKLFAFAGLYETWKAPEGHEVRSCTVITTEANQFMKSLHDRMPVILASPAEWTAWLDLKNEHARSLLRPLPEDALDCYAVSVAVNNPRNESAELILPEKSVA